LLFSLLVAATSFGLSTNEVFIASIAEGNMDAAKILLEKGGADANAKDKEDTTALMFAAYGGQIEMVKLLLAKGAEVNVKDKEDTTALMFASFKGHAEVVKTTPIQKRH